MTDYGCRNLDFMVQGSRWTIDASQRPSFPASQHLLFYSMRYALFARNLTPQLVPRNPTSLKFRCVKV